MNWLYWKSVIDKAGTLYWDYLKAAHDNERIWAAHVKELLAVIDGARRMNAGILFVIWPNLQDVNDSAEITGRICKFLEENNVWALDLGRKLKGRKAADLIVNSMDGHPNDAVHCEVAHMVFQWLDEKGQIGWK